MLETIILARHGQSTHNAGRLEAAKTPEKDIPLTDLGIAQARELGKRIGSHYLTGGYHPLAKGALVYVSPYKRAWDTLINALQAAGEMAIGKEAERPILDKEPWEDPRLRELDHGYRSVEEIEAMMDLRDVHGKFFFRFPDGQCPADLYSECAAFIRDMFEDAEAEKKERALIVSHSIRIRTFIMRFFRLPSGVYDTLKSPDNCKPIVIAREGSNEWSIRDNRSQVPDFEIDYRGHWGVWGLQFREAQTGKKDEDYQFFKEEAACASSP